MQFSCCKNWLKSTVCDNGSPEKSWQRGEIKLSGPLKIRLICSHLNCTTFAAKWSKREKTILLKFMNSTCAATVWSKVWNLIFAESVDLFVLKIYQVWISNQQSWPVTAIETWQRCVHTSPHYITSQWIFKPLLLKTFVLLFCSDIITSYFLHY